nr:hypothetical protein [Candidatus Microthrix sp.]
MQVPLAALTERSAPPRRPDATIERVITDSRLARPGTCSFRWSPSATVMTSSAQRWSPGATAALSERSADNLGPDSLPACCSWPTPGRR